MFFKGSLVATAYLWTQKGKGENMRAIVLAMTLAAMPSICDASSLYANCRFEKTISAELPFNGDAPVFEEAVSELSVMIADEELEDNRAMLIGNNGTSELYLSIGPLAISYTEGTHSGSITATTIYMISQMASGKYAAAHVRTTNLAPPDSPIGAALPSLWVGSCQIERR